MPIEGWRSLIETTNWGGGVIILHNLPFSYVKVTKSVSTTVTYSCSSFYELQKSASTWNPPDFKVLTNR